MRILFTVAQAEHWLLSWRYKHVVEDDVKELFIINKGYMDDLLLLLDAFNVTRSE